MSMTKQFWLIALALVPSLVHSLPECSCELQISYFALNPDILSMCAGTGARKRVKKVSKWAYRKMFNNACTDDLKYATDDNVTVTDAEVYELDASGARRVLRQRGLSHTIEEDENENKMIENEDFYDENTNDHHHHGRFLSCPPVCQTSSGSCSPCCLNMPDCDNRRRRRLSGAYGCTNQTVRKFVNRFVKGVYLKQINNFNNEQKGYIDCVANYDDPKDFTIWVGPNAKRYDILVNYVDMARTQVTWNYVAYRV